MNYHNIEHDSMMNGSGLRVVLFVSGCNHFCKNCQNPQTWDCESGIKFDNNALNEIYEQLKKDYISGITFSGGDPLHENNLQKVYDLIQKIKINFPDKNIWLYTGYSWEELKPYIHIRGITHKDNIHNMRASIINLVDVLVDGEFIKELADVKYQWAGSTNQRVIDVKKSLKSNEVVLWGTKNTSERSLLNN